MDPGYPQEWLLDVVQDSAPMMLLMQEALPGPFAGLDLVEPARRGSVRSPALLSGLKPRNRNGLQRGGT